MSKPALLRIQHFQRKESTQPDFYIRTLPEHRHEHPFITEAHAHDFYLLLLFTHGSGTHTIDLNTYTVQPGSVFFMTPSEIHSWRLSDDANGYILFFNTSFYLLDNIPKNLTELPFFRIGNKLRHGVLSAKVLKEMERVCRNIVAENSQPSAFQKNILRAYLDVLLYKMAAALPAEIPASPAPLSLVPELQLLVEHYFLQQRAISFYAERLHVSPKQLNTLTKNYLGKTVPDLLRERLITEARRLLVHSAMTVSEIAYALNFNDNSYFNRFFKRSEGITPELFRKRFL